jgi:hypothetical protein
MHFIFTALDKLNYNIYPLVVITLYKNTRYTFYDTVSHLLNWNEKVSISNTLLALYTQ